jgi:hypothetical protein
MKPTYTNSLPCAVFGHNYIKSKTHSDSTAELTCSHCKVIIKTDDFGNFIETSKPSKDIQATLRKLYHLKLRAHKLSIS